MKLKKKFEITGHSSSIYVLANFNDELFMSGGGDKILATWKYDDGENFKFQVKTNSPILACKNIDNHLLLGLFNGNFHVIDASNRKEIKFIPYHKESIFDIIVDETNNQLFLLSADGSVSIWNLNSFDFVKAIKVCDDKIRKGIIKENELVLACGTGDVAFLDLLSHEITFSFIAHDKVNAIAMHPSKPVLITAGKDAHLKFWNIKNNYKELLAIDAHNWAIYDIKFINNNSHFVTCSRDKTMKIWDANTLDLVHRVEYKTHKSHTHSINSMLWNESKKTLFSGSDDRKIIAWELE